MTDRVQVLTVVLEEDTREDDAQAMANLIEQVRGVHRVELGDAVNSTDWLARDRAARELRGKIWRLLEGTYGPKALESSQGALLEAAKEMVAHNTVLLACDYHEGSYRDDCVYCRLRAAVEDNDGT
jgi:hypothetical protein